MVSALKSMRLLVVSFSVGNVMGDSFTAVTRSLARHHQVSVLTNTACQQELPGVQAVCRVAFSKTRILDFVDPRRYYSIWKFVRNRRFDVVFIYTSHPVNAFIYALLRNIPVVPFVHDHILHEGVPGFDAVFHRMNLWLYYHRSAKIIVSCHYIKDDILDKQFMTDGERIAVNYLGMLPNLVFPESGVAEDVDVLFFGRVEAYKGLDTLVDVAGRLPDVQFVVVGKGDFVRVSGCQAVPSNIVRVDAYIDDHRLAEYIQRAKLIVLPYHDATGTQTVQAAFYYGKPVVATRVGCFPEYVTDGEDGLLCRPRDAEGIREAIVRLLSHPSLRQQMGAKGKQKLATLFSEEAITRHYEQIFLSVCQS